MLLVCFSGGAQLYVMLSGNLATVSRIMYAKPIYCMMNCFCFSFCVILNLIRFSGGGKVLNMYVSGVYQML